MTNQDSPFKYTIKISADKLSYYEEEFVYFVIANYKLVNNEYSYTIEFPAEKNGVKGTPNSGNLRDSFSQYIFETTYEEVKEHSQSAESERVYIGYIDDIIGNALFEAHYMADYQTSNVQHLSLKRTSKQLVQRNEIGLKKLQEYIDLLSLDNFDNYTISLNHSKFSNSDYTFDIRGNENLQRHIRSFIKQDIKDFLASFSNEDERSYIGIAMDILRQGNNEPVPTSKYLQSLYGFAKVLKPNTQSSNWNRLFILLINKLDELFNYAFTAYHKQSESNLRNSKFHRHLCVLHTLSLFDLIPTEDRIYNILYSEDTTRNEVKDAVKDFMRNKLYK
ncbi:hypothetical protein [Sphingobacterium litopenaei]|uniref:Uncharacterized protein n=1 Tax=Sphingobacterium litopenaei TaxID=2763500 RepID=A0ABR7YHZ7_9SPHI|nr:hypothetical protein [Sphingobacterium litopenaei]MBD1430912.1 hypothetical protein [Sphingobacterium litopenaei]